MRSKHLIRILILLMLFAQILYSWGVLDADRARLMQAKEASAGKFEEKFVRVTSELEAKLFVGCALFLKERRGSLPNADLIAGQVRSAVENALRVPAGVQSEGAMAWFLRYQAALGVFFDLPEKGRQLLDEIHAAGEGDELERRLDEILDKALSGETLSREELTLTARELGTAGKALVIKMSDDADLTAQLTQQVLMQFYRVLFFGALFVGTLLIGLFFTLFYGVVLFFGLGRRWFEPASFDPESLLWTWAAYLAGMFGMGLLLQRMFKPESLVVSLGVQTAVILASLVLLGVPRAAGHPWSAVRRALGLRARSLGALLKDLLIGPTFYLASLVPLIVFMMFFSLIMSLFKMDVRSAAHPIVFMLMRGERGVVLLSGLLAVVIAPLVEEILFRGALYGWLRARASAVVSIAASALVFAVIHPQGPLGVPVLFVVGCFLAILREWRGSLAAPIMFHACFNGVTFLAVTTMLRGAG